MIAFQYNKTSLQHLEKQLKEAKKSRTFLNAGEFYDHPCCELEKRCGDLYGLFCVEGMEPPAREENRRIYYQL